MSTMWSWLAPTLTVAGAVAVALALRALVLSGLRRWGGGRNGTSYADAIRFPSFLWALVAALYIATDVSDLPRRFAHPLTSLFQVAVIVSITFTAADILGGVIRRAGERHALTVAVTGLGQAVARAVVFALGALVLLSALGIAITPVLTALGVGGLAVALALQDTLSNLFAGVHLLADKPIRVGDYAKLAEGIEGFVIDIGWRSTRFRTMANNVVIVPNKKVAESMITNFHLPDAFSGLAVKVVVDYGADADRVERALLEEAMQAAAENAAILRDPPPQVRLIPGFGTYGLEFTVSCQISSVGDHAAVEHELRKRFLKRLRAERVPIAAPVQLADLRQPGSLADQRQ
jgi:small-conductance mechanosensitive channel